MIPSPSQAKLMARCFDQGSIGIDIPPGYITPTQLALIKRGWVSPTAAPPEHRPNRKVAYRLYVLTAAGRLALAEYLQRTAQT